MVAAAILADTPLRREGMLEEGAAFAAEDTRGNAQVAADTPVGRIVAADIRGRLQLAAHNHTSGAEAGAAAAILVAVQRTVVQLVEVVVDIREAADSAL